MRDMKSQPEPSMEEIIAHIRRIIAEDKPQGDKRPADPVRAAPDGSDVLELTEAVNEDGSIRRITPAGRATALSAKQEATPDASAATAGVRIEPEHPQGIEPRLDHSRERIVSATTAGAPAAALPQLGALPSDSRHEGDL